MQIKFASLLEGAEYNLSLRTFSVVEGVYYEGVFGAPFFTPATATKPKPLPRPGSLRQRA